MTTTVRRILLGIAALCALLVVVGVDVGDLDSVRLIGGSLFFGWLALLD